MAGPPRSSASPPTPTRETTSVRTRRASRRAVRRRRGAAAAVAITRLVVAFLVEPIQGEAGVIVPPTGTWPAVRELCTANGVLLVADEIQSGLGRTGNTFACDARGRVPDVYVLGKALGGGICRVSAVVATLAVLGVFKPGQHGSTFGGNPLAARSAARSCAMLCTGEYQERAATLGDHMHARLRALPATRSGRSAAAGSGPASSSRAGGPRVVRASDGPRRPGQGDPRPTIRLAPPLVISEDDLDWGLDQIEEVVTRP